MHSSGSSTAICKISLRFSPRRKNRRLHRAWVSKSLTFQQCDLFLPSNPENQNDPTSARGRLYSTFSAVCRKNWLLTPGISTGYWKAIKSLLCPVPPATVQTDLTFERNRAASDLVFTPAGGGERAFPGTVSAHNGVNCRGESPGFRPRKIAFSSTPTCKSLMLMAVFLHH